MGAVTTREEDPGPNFVALTRRRDLLERLPPPARRAELRRRLRITQEALGQALVPPVSQRAISMWENDESEPADPHLAQYVAFNEWVEEQW